MNWYDRLILADAQSYTEPMPYKTYTDYAHEPGQQSIVWIHDGMRLKQKPIVNEVNSMGAHTNGHASEFTAEEYNVCLAAGRVDPAKNEGSFVFYGWDEPMQLRRFPKIAADLMGAFPTVSFWVPGSPNAMLLQDVLREQFGR